VQVLGSVAGQYLQGPKVCGDPRPLGGPGVWWWPPIGRIPFSPVGGIPLLNGASAEGPERNRLQCARRCPGGNIDGVEQSAIRNETMNSTLETTLWPQSPMPQTQGTAWHWQITTLRQLSGLRADLRKRLRSAGCDDASRDGDPVSDRILLAVDELASNALRHGAEPVHARVMATADGWLIDISDAATDQGPHPAIGRDPALGGMGLHLVAEVTTGHGWAVIAGRKHVWASLPLDMTDRTPRAARDLRGVDQSGPRNPRDVPAIQGMFPYGDVQLPSLTDRPVQEAPTCDVVGGFTRQPSTGPSGTERQSMDSVPLFPPSRPGRWAALTGTLSPQRRALANARRAVERDLRAAAQREEAG
jgi:anti-sigma regulatory factor (Ser/Thr protein kinase)